MVSNKDNWVRIFDIPETSKHKKGFTLYKLISLLYPADSPDAVTKITVWKRFNDIKKLHREMKVLHGSLGIKDRFPGLSNSSFFRRFDDEVIQARRQSSLSFLEYVGTHPQLFTSSVFVKFFETSHTPADHLNSKINSIRAELNLPEDPEYTFLSLNSDDERTLSDTDSVSTLSSLSPSVQADILEPLTRSISSLGRLSKVKNKAVTSDTQDSISVSTAGDLYDGQIYPTPPHTPGSSIVIENPTQYVMDAECHINLAKELEATGKYEEAFNEYKTGIDILLENVKGDEDYERKKAIRFKTEIYLLRAEKLYNMYLSPEVKNIHDLNKTMEQPVNHSSISDLYKYKVIRVISSGMLVLHSETQKLFYIKVIQKTTKFLNDNLILPESVPYMVKLYNYYNCENAIFLVLEYCSGKKLWDYVKERSADESYVSHQENGNFIDTFNNQYESDESDHSYSDLINDYTTNKTKINLTNGDSRQTVERPKIEESGSDRAEINKRVKETDFNLNKKMLSSSQRQSSDKSLFEDYDFVRNYVIPIEDVVKWASQLIVALEELHKIGIICCDLQSKNLLIDDKGDLVLTYMCSINHTQDIFGGENDLYLAPEMYTLEKITPAVDWWSFGAILYELLVGEPLKTLHPDGLNSYTVLKIPRYISPEGRSLLKQLLNYDPSDRLGCGINGSNDLKSHPFFSKVSWDCLIKTTT